MDTYEPSAIESAYQLLNESVLYFNGKPVGTVAAKDPHVVAENYDECFVRDFVPSALVFLMKGQAQIVRNFLTVVLDLRSQQLVMAGHSRANGLMPASFKVIQEDGKEKLVADFGERAIGRVAPVDSALWWMILLRTYVRASGDIELARSHKFQEGIRTTLLLYLTETFETSPAMLVPDGSFMIDRRMGVHGHPLEIQALFYGSLLAAQELLLPNEDNAKLVKQSAKRLQTLRSYVRIYYWLDIARLNEIHRYNSEEFGLDAVNVLNLQPGIIPNWLDGWLSQESGYFVGNIGPGRTDFRYFSFGNLLAILFGLATEEQGQRIMNLFATHWDTLIGEMPLKICYPAVEGNEWELMTGCDPKNVAWSYHNGGHWPTLLWCFTGAAIRMGRLDLAHRALDLCQVRLPHDQWPEYYDGKTGWLIGRKANFYQVWSATGFIIAHDLLTDADTQTVFDAFTF